MLVGEVKKRNKEVHQVVFSVRRQDRGKAKGGGGAILNTTAILNNKAKTCVLLLSPLTVEEWKVQGRRHFGTLGSCFGNGQEKTQARSRVE